MCLVDIQGLCLKLIRYSGHLTRLLSDVASKLKDYINIVLKIKKGKRGSVKNLFECFAVTMQSSRDLNALQ